jgi:hypothetical protein
MQHLDMLNREFSKARMQTYAETMSEGKWYSTPDPIVVTTDGHLINGQHRLAAGCWVKWGVTQKNVFDESIVTVGYHDGHFYTDPETCVIPEFIVVWDADPKGCDPDGRSEAERR